MVNSVELVNNICKENYENAVELLEKVIACKSYSGNEQDCARVLAEYFAENNIPFVADSRGSLLAVSTPFANDEFIPADNAKQWIAV